MPPEHGVGPVFSFMPLILIFLIWYFLAIKPQMDKQKQHKQLVASLKKNDQVVTAGGIHATVVNVKDKTAIVRIDDNVKVEIDKESISAVIKSSS